jgi:hypothetical protein
MSSESDSEEYTNTQYEGETETDYRTEESRPRNRLRITHEGKIFLKRKYLDLLFNLPHFFLN